MNTEDKIKFLFAEHQKLDPSTPEATEIWDAINTAMLDLKAGN